MTDEWKRKFWSAMWQKDMKQKKKWEKNDRKKLLKWQMEK